MISKEEKDIESMKEKIEEKHAQAEHLRK